VVFADRRAGFMQKVGADVGDPLVQPGDFRFLFVPVVRELDLASEFTLLAGQAFFELFEAVQRFDERAV